MRTVGLTFAIILGRAGLSELSVAGWELSVWSNVKHCLTVILLLFFTLRDWIWGLHFLRLISRLVVEGRCTITSVRSAQSLHFRDWPAQESVCTWAPPQSYLQNLAVLDSFTLFMALFSPKKVIVSPKVPLHVSWANRFCPQTRFLNSQSPFNFIGWRQWSMQSRCPFLR